MYFSSSLYYSSKYTKDKDSPDGKPFIICMITPGNVYPGYLISVFFFYFSKRTKVITNFNQKNSDRKSIS